MSSHRAYESEPFFFFFYYCLIFMIEGVSFDDTPRVELVTFICTSMFGVSKSAYNQVIDR